MTFGTFLVLLYTIYLCEEYSAKITESPELECFNHVVQQTVSIS